MQLKIYFDNKPLFLCDKLDPSIEPYLHHDDAVFIDEFNSHTVKSMLHEMQLEKVHAGVFLHPDFDALKHAFFKKFTVIKAGGGLVRNENAETLLIHRRGNWDLPKGKLDKGETIEECAVREVQEETGLKEVRIVEPLITTYHTYHEGTRFVLKESHWFTMHASSDQPLTPQTEEDIEQIRWVADDELDFYVINSYPSIGDVLKAWLPK